MDCSQYSSIYIFWLLVYRLYMASFTSLVALHWLLTLQLGGAEVLTITSAMGF